MEYVLTWACDRQALGVSMRCTGIDAWRRWRLVEWSVGSKGEVESMQRRGRLSLLFNVDAVDADVGWYMALY